MSVKRSHAISGWTALAVPAETSSSAWLRPIGVSSDCSVISGLTRKAIQRAGVESGRKGAHVFRHSLATAMLRQGASLDEIGQVLRHRDADTTAIYAKVDLDALRRLAVAWPGGAL